MLHRKNKGSILIISLITFSTISLICMTCSSLILSNNKIIDLDYKTEKLVEENLGIIEIIKSNILKEVNYCVKNTKTEDEFYNYLEQDNHKEFIAKVKDMSDIPFENKSMEIEYDEKISSKEFIHYKISVKSKINNYEKYSFINVRIKNPWFGITSQDEDKNMQLNIDELIEFYNYKEKQNYE